MFRLKEAEATVPRGGISSASEHYLRTGIQGNRENPESLAAIREHPHLKGYPEPGVPPGYLLLKSHSNPGNFVRRCQDLGFEVHSM